MRTHALAARGRSRPAGGRAHERQADHVAARFLRGETRLARHVTPAPAAGFTLPASPGIPLAGGLRAELESAFGADLGAVRLHADAPAASAAASMNASAFASGAHVYFASGQFRPSTLPGRELLAHEVAHVLQQTAAVTHRDAVAARDLTGSGAVQCDGTNTPPDDPQAVLQQKDEFEQLARIYRGSRRPGSDSELDSTIDAVRTHVGGRLAWSRPGAAFAVALGEAVDRGEFGSLKSIKARSFLLECLKVLGYFDQAARILESDTRFELRTLTVFQDFAEYLATSPKFGRKWLSRFLSHRDFARPWPAAIVKGWRNFFLRPERVDDPDPALLAKYEGLLSEIQQRRGVTPPSLRGEHYYVAWSLVVQLDYERAQEALALSNRLLSLRAKISLRELLIIDMSRLRGEALKQAEDQNLSGAERTIAAQKILLIDEWLPFWKKALEQYAALVATFAGFSAADLALDSKASRFPDASGIAPLLQPLRKTLVEAAVAAFKPEFTTWTDSYGSQFTKLKLPSPDEYQARLSAFDAALSTQPLVLKKGGAQRVWAEHATTLLIEAAAARKPDAQAMMLLAVLSFVVTDLLFFVRSYDVDRDKLSPAFEDLRGAHRFRFAKQIAAFARWLRWDDLRAAASPVLVEAEDESLPEDLREPVLWLASDWEPDERMPVTRLGEDFPERLDKPVLRDTPLTVRHIVEWFRYDYSKRLRETLEELLRDEDFLRIDTNPDFTAINRLRHSKGEVSAAMAPSAQAELAIRDEDARDLPLTRPHRFIVRDWEVRVPPGAALDWNALVTNHTKTQKQVVRRAAGGTIFPTTVGQGVFGWALPSLAGLVAFMRRIPALAQLARNNLLPDADWIEQLALSESDKPEFSPADLAKVRISAEDWAKLNETLITWLKRFREQEEKQLPGLWRRTVILYRRWRVLKIRERIDHYAKYTTVTGGPVGETGEATVERRAIPERVVELYHEFESDAYAMLQDAENPDAAAETQTALLVLGMSPSLLKVNPRLIDGYFKRNLYAMFAFAIDFAEDEAKLERLKAGTGEPDEVNAIVFSKDRLATTVREMRAMMTVFEQELAEIQEDSGYGSYDGSSIRPNDSHFPSTIEASDTPDATKSWTPGRGAFGGGTGANADLPHQLVKVYRKFWFYPQTGMGTAAGMRKSAGGPVRPATIVYIDDSGQKREVVAPDQDPEAKEVFLFTMLIGEHRQDYKAGDVQELTELGDVFMWRSFQLGMAETYALIETFGDYILLVVTIIAPEIALVEFVIRMADMFATGQFDDLVEQLQKDPFDLAEQLIKDLKERLFDPAAIWQYLLLGGQSSPWSTLSAMLPRRQRKFRHPPTTKFGRVVAALRALGSRFSHGLQRFRDYTQPPLRSAQGRIGMRPTLVWLLRRAAHLGETAADLIPPDMLRAVAGDASKLGELGDLFSGQAGSIGKEMSESTVELLEGIRHFELPGELLDLDVATELIIGFLLGMFGARGKIARVLLEAAPVPSEWAGRGEGNPTNAMQLISSEIAKLWRDSAVDPNKYWREDILPIIGHKFGEVRDRFVEVMYELIHQLMDAVGLDKAMLKAPEQSELPATEVVPDTLTDEAEAALGTRTPDPTVAFALLPTGGRSLDERERRRYESALGADLSHVRLHANAASATTGIGADAVTSGSHVFLRPGLSISSTQGRRLLSHELTHVVQQTGAVGRGTLGLRGPTAGRPGLGLRRIPAREAVAEGIAERVVRGTAVPASLRADIGTASGVQPSIETVVEGVLDVLTKDTEKESFTRTPKAGDPPGWKDDAPKLAQEVFARLKVKEKMEFARFIRGTPEAPQAVATYLAGRDKVDPTTLKKITALAQKPIRRKKKDAPDTEFSPKLFLQLLANYLYADWHVALRITASSSFKDVDKIEVFNIDLPEIGGGADLWKLVMKETFPSGTVEGLSTAKAQPELRQRLRSQRGQRTIFDNDNFKFAKWLVDDYVEELKARERAKVGEVPEVTKYVDTESDSGQGLAVATHGELTKRGIGKFGRESHHTTQYLLIEFFSNHKDASRKAFPSVKDFKDGGIEADGEKVKRISGVGGYLDVAPLDPDSNRGSNMPAILLSARCHQRGELHILREPRWEDDDQQSKEMRGTPTQGLAIENRFNSAITDKALRPRETSDPYRKKLRERIAADPTAAQQQYYSAALATYAWMRNRMLPALKQGLLTEEKAYYRGIAAQKHSKGDDLEPAYQLEDHHLVHVYNVAAKNNDKVMADYHWKAK